MIEKAKMLEGKMRYQIDKLVKMAKEVPNPAANDLLLGRWSSYDDVEDTSYSTTLALQTP